MGISIIIVSYKSENYLLDCIYSIKKNIGDFQYEIIVVNNDPSSDLSIIKSELKNIRVLQQNKNVGFAKGCNTGAATANYDFLLFLNPDTSFHTGSFIKLIEKFKDTTIGIISPLLLLPTKEMQPWSCGDDFNFFNLLKNKLGIINKISMVNQNDFETDWVSGASLLITKKVFENIGGFDENFFMYFEDIDLCKRVKNSGYKVKISPETTFIHHGGQSYRDKSKQKSHYYTSQDYYFRKHFGIMQFFMVSLLRKIVLLLKK